MCQRDYLCFPGLQNDGVEDSKPRDCETNSFLVYKKETEAKKRTKTETNHVLSFRERKLRVAFTVILMGQIGGFARRIMMNSLMA